MVRADAGAFGTAVTLRGVRLVVLVEALGGCADRLCIWGRIDFKSVVLCVSRFALTDVG